MHSLDRYSSLPQAFFAKAKADPRAVVYSQAQIVGEKREWRAQSYGEVAPRICALAAQLKALGVKRGDTVAIISASRPEWMEMDLAILSLGAVVVSVYPSLAVHEVGYILFDSQARIAVVENQEQFDKVRQLNSEPCHIPATEEREATEIQLRIEHLITFEQLGAEATAIHFSRAASFSPAITPDQICELKHDDLAALVYTSGTTGPPKGVMQTHGNHLSNVRQVLSAGLVGEKSSIMVFLPLAHSFAKLMGYLGFLSSCTNLFPAVPDRRSSKLDADSVTRDIREGSAEIVPIVPRILEKMQGGIVKRSHERSIAGMMVRLAFWSAKKVYRKEASTLARLTFAITKGIRRKIKLKLFGPNFIYAISGGAKLNSDVNYFFDILEIEVLEGYGLTETCVATNANRPGKKKIGTVGPVLADDIELKIAPDGEILFRGPNITSAYFKREIATRNSWDREGWFHTGDMGALDQDRYLSIVGRKKELLVTSYGKKIAPEGIEDALKSSPYIAQAVLLGDARAYCTALLTLEYGVVKEWASKRGVKLEGALGQIKALTTLIQGEVDRVNASLASFEQVKRFAVLDQEFSIENGLLTPTFKVKRREVAKRFATEIEGLYRE